MDGSVTWFPEHGAALLAAGQAAAPGGTIIQRKLSIIGLDNWKFEPHWMNPPRYGKTMGDRTSFQYNYRVTSHLLSLFGGIQFLG